MSVNQQHPQLKKSVELENCLMRECTCSSKVNKFNKQQRVIHVTAAERTRERRDRADRASHKQGRGKGGGGC